MNKVELLGRLTKDPDVKYTQGEKSMCIARYTMAVNRRFKSGDQSADFINCVAFGKQGEFVEKYLKKGMQIAVCGRIQTGSYTNKDGQKVYTTDVVVEEHEFTGTKKENEQATQSEPEAPKQESNDGFMNIPDGINEELPFN